MSIFFEGNSCTSSGRLSHKEHSYRDMCIQSNQSCCVPVYATQSFDLEPGSPDNITVGELKFFTIFIPAAT